MEEHFFMVMDMSLVLDARRLSQEQHGRTASVFVYEFSHPTEVPGFPECSGKSCHTAELPYVFDNVSSMHSTWSSLAHPVHLLFS